MPTLTASSRGKAEWQPCSMKLAWPAYTGWTVPFCNLRYDGHGGARRRGGGGVTPTRMWNLVVIGAACAAASWLVLRGVYSGLRPLPGPGEPALLLLAIAESWSGRNLRARLRGD